jgi:predicted ATPase
MYISSINIENVRSIQKFEIAFSPAEYAGWHVLIGDNGAGKTTIVRAIALALVGNDYAQALRQDWNEWLRKDNERGSINLSLSYEGNFDYFSKTGRKPSKGTLLPVGIEFVRERPQNGNGGINTSLVKTKQIISTGIKPNRHIYGEGYGWFCASYGPYRRFSGGNETYEKLFYANPHLARHLSAFGEDVALTECLTWLRELHIKKLEGKEEGKYLEHIKSFVNDCGLLPHNTHLDSVDSDSVFFRDGNNCAIPVENLSDGYRSILSMTFELIRQMVRSYGYIKVFEDIVNGSMQIDLPGVVLIDEIDAHLHPSWQKEIGFWFRKYFPRIQFIVATHSPLVCRAAEKGTIWRLPTPGSAAPHGRISGTDMKRLIYGNVLESFGTDLFGENIARSESAREKLIRLAILANKMLKEKLNDNEEKEFDELRAIFPTTTDYAKE